VVSNRLAATHLPARPEARVIGLHSPVEIYRKL
jgi:hypothetical protein